MPGKEIYDAHKNDAVDSGCKTGNRIFRWCHSEKSVSSLIAENPNLTPGEAWQKLFHGEDLSSSGPGDTRNAGTETTTDEELRQTRSCGKWGSRQPSDLFIKLYHDALCTLDDDPGRGVEVFLATNFWQNSVASRFITNAIRELSRRAQARGTRVIMKIIYDRGNPKQVFDPHHSVPESEYTGGAVNLPPAKDIPYVHLQVVNFHQPVLGTFHAKYMIVDRKIGILQSDNIQDNDNLEMMVQVEGPIVDSLYDVAMISWHKKLDPPMPCLHPPAVSVIEPTSFGAGHASIFSSTGSIEGHSAVVDPAMMPTRKPYGIEATSVNGELANIANRDSSIERSPRVRNSSNSLEIQSGNRQKLEQNSLASEQPSAVALVASSETPKGNSLPAVQSPHHTDEIWPEHTTDDPHYDNDIADEVSRIQATVSAGPNETAMQAVTRHLNHTKNLGFPGNAPTCNPSDEMTPYIPHPAHEPFPMAFVNRAPYGRPNHKSVTNPQNAAWLSALRNAQRNVFIQTPTLNAQPLIPAIAEACERGVDVYCYVCLGYNDAGEMLPMQGGHNEKVAHQIYTTLSASGRQHLRWYWYVAKDQTRPIPASEKKRSCHIKLMIVDEHVAIVGNGNLDTQSYYHSQEINLMMDSPDICRSWIDALRRNQNTGIYGAVDPKDGIWRDEAGKEIEGATGVNAGRFSWFYGFLGAVRRLQGTGGF
ncbi:hypothetical protein CIB48_g11443 [Xylaria polymorpha]|nr:hypothetical protein CIB48_g11443 [Xylaria polymorpha]